MSIINIAGLDDLASRGNPTFTYSEFQNKDGIVCYVFKYQGKKTFLDSADELACMERAARRLKLLLDHAGNDDNIEVAILLSDGTYAYAEDDFLEV